MSAQDFAVATIPLTKKMMSDSAIIVAEAKLDCF
jgi:hypothetical protein